MNNIFNNLINDEYDTNTNKYSFDKLNEEIISDNDDESDKKYMEPTILQSINLDKYFSKDDIEFSTKNNKLLKITDKGLYSISKHYDAEWITKNIVSFLKSKDIIPSKTNIIDGTAGIGGNTINFAKYFAKVYSIEINKTHYEVLKNNVDALSIFNVDVYLDNFLNIINDNQTILKKFKSNIFFFDPPWGGKSYKNYKYFNLKIGKLPIYTIINNLFDKNFKYVILKAPYNLNLSPIFSSIKYENMNINSNFKKNMIIVIFY